jgi:pyridoxamine 5'-phosphate oxidase
MSEVFRNYINTVRRDFADQPLNIEAVNDNPYTFFEKWFDEAVGAEVLDPYAMALATANKNGRPGTCVVYMRDITDNGLVFYTNYNSRKGKDLEENPKVSVNFFWVELDRQIRFTGSATKAAKNLSDQYFAKRPRLSQISAWASDQSSEIPNREYLEERFKYFEEKFKDKEVPRPPHWGGYLIKPEAIEFWQGRPNRLHDRIVFYKGDQGSWSKRRLSP